MLDRRTLVALLAGATLAAASSPLLAAPSPGRVSVDVSRLTAQGLGPNAARIKLAMERELAGALPGLRDGNSLVVTVRGINMTSYSGGGGTIGGGTANDGMDSVATVIGRDGRVVATYPVLSSSSATSAGPWYAPDIDARRIDSLVRTNAGWIRRYVGG
jgi:hypothetical protein